MSRGRPSTCQHRTPCTPRDQLSHSSNRRGKRYTSFLRQSLETGRWRSECNRQIPRRHRYPTRTGQCTPRGPWSRSSIRRGTLCTPSIPCHLGTVRSSSLCTTHRWLMGCRSRQHTPCSPCCPRPRSRSRPGSSGTTVGLRLAGTSLLRTQWSWPPPPGSSSRRGTRSSSRSRSGSSSPGSTT